MPRVQHNSHRLIFAASFRWSTNQRRRQGVLATVIRIAFKHK